MHLRRNLHGFLTYVRAWYLVRMSDFHVHKKPPQMHIYFTLISRLYVSLFYVTYLHKELSSNNGLIL